MSDFAEFLNTINPGGPCTLENIGRTKKYITKKLTCYNVEYDGSDTVAFEKTFRVERGNTELSQTYRILDKIRDRKRGKARMYGEQDKGIKHFTFPFYWGLDAEMRARMLRTEEGWIDAVTGDLYKPIDYKKVPNTLYHGTIRQHKESICKEGLKTTDETTVSIWPTSGTSFWGKDARVEVGPRTNLVYYWRSLSDARTQAYTSRRVSAYQDFVGEKNPEQDWWRKRGKYLLGHLGEKYTPYVCRINTTSLKQRNCEFIRDPEFPWSYQAFATTCTSPPEIIECAKVSKNMKWEKCVI